MKSQREGYLQRHWLLQSYFATRGYHLALGNEDGGDVGQSAFGVQTQSSDPDVGDG